MSQSFLYCFYLKYLAQFFLLFPVWEPNYFETPPAELGEFAVIERTVQLRRGADGCPLEITIFEPEGASGPRPTLVWVLGSNVQPYYHQSLHETLASHGFVVIVPETRPLTFIIDRNYHGRNVANAVLATRMALDGDLGVEVDPDSLAVGGYSIGGTMATFTAAEMPEFDAIVTWAPTSSPFWLGVDAPDAWSQVTQPTLYLLGELDTLSAPGGFSDRLANDMPGSEGTFVVIPNGTHLYFQQPLGADSPSDPVTPLTRFEQQGIAISETLNYLKGKFGP